MSKIKVTFHRTYEIDMETINEHLFGDAIQENENPEEVIKETAEKIAMNLMSEEMIYFEDNLNDFVSSTVEIIPNFK